MNKFTSASASGALRQYPRFDFQFFPELRRHCNVFAARQALDRQRFETGVHFRLLGHPQQRAEILGYIAVFAGCELAADERLQGFGQRDDDGCHGRRRRRLGSQSAYYWNCYPLSLDTASPVERSGAVDIFMQFPNGATV